MKITLLETIVSTCGCCALNAGSELNVTDTDEQRGVYEVSHDDGFFVVPFQCAEAIVEPVPVDEGRPSKIRVIRDLPEFGGLEIKKGDTFRPIRTTDDVYFVSTLSALIQIPIDAAEVIERRTVLQDWGFKESIKPQIERDGPKIKLLRALMSNCGQCKASENLVLDIIHTDHDKKIHLCKGPFSEAVTYDVPFFYGELLEQEKQKEQNQRPFKIKIIKILPGMDHSGIDLGDELYPITWKDNCYGVEVNSVRWLIPKEAAEVIETRPVEKKPVIKELIKPDINGKYSGGVCASLGGNFGKPPSKYHRLNIIKDKEYVDFYDIINLLQSNGDPIPPEIQHALKKLMYNDRGHKNMVQDKKEAVWSVNRWLENNENS